MIFIGMLMNDEEKSKLFHIYEKYKKYMYVIAYEVVREHSKAEDVVSDSILKISGVLSNIKDLDSYKTKGYIAAIVKNTALDMYRKNKGRNIKFDESYMGLVPDVSLEIEYKDEYRRVVTAINKLPDIYRDVLIMRYVNELEDDQIAKSLGISKEVVRKRAERGRKRIIFALGEFGDKDE